MRPSRLIAAGKLACLLLTLSVMAQEPTLVVRGTLQWYDGSAAPYQTIVAVKMDQQGREIEIIHEGKPLPPLATARTDKDGKFVVEVPKNQFGGMVMRFGFRAPLGDGEERRYARWQDGTIAVLAIDLTAESVDLDKEEKIIFLKRK